MKRILITGMSGTGKSTLIAELGRRGHKAVDTDYGEYSHMVAAPPGELTGPGGGQDWVWREDRIEALLSDEDAEVLFVSGCSPNQKKFYDRFDHIVLLSAPAEVVAERLTARTNNAFGKMPGELERTLQLVQTVEPGLQKRADLEIDSTLPVAEVADKVLKLSAGDG